MPLQPPLPVPPPGITINVPVPSVTVQEAAGSIWTVATPGLIGVGGVLLGAVLTALWAKGRERDQFLVEEKAKLYVDVLARYRRIVHAQSFPDRDPTSREYIEDEAEKNQIQARISLYGSEMIKVSLEAVTQAEDEMLKFVMDCEADGLDPNDQPETLAKYQRAIWSAAITMEATAKEDLGEVGESLRKTLRTKLWNWMSKRGIPAGGH